MMGITTWLTTRILEDIHEEKGLLELFGINILQALNDRGFGLNQIHTAVQANRDVLAQRTRQLDLQSDQISVLNATNTELAMRVSKLETIIVAADQAVQPDTPAPKKAPRRRTRKTAT